MIDPKFARFLKTHHAYVKFCHYFRKYGNKRQDKEIDFHSISWELTSEGIDYWNKLNQMWINDLLRDYFTLYRKSAKQVKRRKHIIR